MIKKRRNYMIVSMLVGIYIAGYIICLLFFSKVPMYSYTADWTASHYFLFVWVIAILFAIFNLQYTSLITTAGCFIGIVLGDVIGQKIIDSNWREINQLIKNGINVSIETLNQADYHKGVFIWLCAIFISIIIGLMIDILHKRRLKLTHN